MDINNIHLSSDGNVCIVTSASKVYRVNTIFFKILCGMKTGLSLEDSVNLVSVETGTDYDILINKFNNFIKTIQNVKSKTYIRCKYVIIKENLVNKIACILTFLFSIKVFIFLLFASIIINIAYIYINYKHLGSSSYDTIKVGCIVFIGYLLSLIIHELGHATATASVGKKAKEIGFGLYMFFPVFYTDVTSVWNMKKKERILVSIGGVYFQLIVNTLMVIVTFIFSQNALTIALNSLIFSNLLVITMSMTPFFRNDGYWILSDYWNLPNLLKRSDDILFHPYIHGGKTCSNEQIKLVLFGFANNSFRIYILIRLTFNLYKNVQEISGQQAQDRAFFVAISILISLIGIYLLFMYYYKIFRNENNERY